LNEAYLQAKAAMIMEQYAEAGQKILSIPAGERTASMYLTLGESFYQAGKYSEAARSFAFSDSLRASPEAKLYVARSFAMMSQPEKSTEWLQKYLSQREKLSEGELGLDPAFAKIEHSKEWKTLWNREWYNAAERKAAEAAVLVKRQKYTDALGIIDVEIANRTSLARFYALRAKVYEAMEQFDPAYESAQTAVRMRNNSPEFFSAAANMAVRVKKYDAALDNINQAIRYDPYQLDLYLQRAAILRMNNRFDEARNDINFYFAYLPADTKALYQMGRAETEAGNPLAGMEYFTILIDNDKSSPDYFIARADAGMKANNYTQASYDLSQALDLNPTIPEVWYKKGIVLHREDKLEDACYYWKSAFRMGSSEAGEYIYKYCIK
jgi:tetratricopeptide (TPR) repeat protein